ncbi:hypothetical protein OH76DRAFT_900072 [Lentinus brumalis]|uniref:Uncharacterized protein n=1 Tax=Lentinus brumalis TaxID=2498619 RepID=A0A371D0V1_9APHY|nr:hypothetical protein OH76DRAFT_900072 [Polyporus brumalis]
MCSIPGIGSALRLRRCPARALLAFSAAWTSKKLSRSLMVERASRTQDAPAKPSHRPGRLSLCRPYLRRARSILGVGPELLAWNTLKPHLQPVSPVPALSQASSSATTKPNPAHRPRNSTHRRSLGYPRLRP